jgi:hypothetical protein
LIKVYFKQTIGLLQLLLFAGRKEEYLPLVKESDVRLLVVKGYINSRQGLTTIHLSRVADKFEAPSKNV